jgi:hypothetical protein
MEDMTSIANYALFRYWCQLAARVNLGFLKPVKILRKHSQVKYDGLHNWQVYARTR